MAISLEELTAAALEGSVGPLTLAVGAGALAVALAAGSTRPLRRIASTSVLAVGRTGQLNPVGWVGAAKRHWSSLVDEARAEYEASHAPRPIIVSPTGATPTDPPPTVLVASSTGAVSEAGSVVVVPESENISASLDRPAEANRIRDQRGRFIRRATNGVQPE